MQAILYPAAVEKKRFGRILCGISVIGTKKGHKYRLWMHLECGNPCLDSGNAFADSAERHGIIAFGEHFLSCAICEIRKEKRFCPAVHGRICPQCCGEQREVTLDCPSDCVYLRQARDHEKPRSISDFDQAGLFPEVEIGEQFLYEQEHLIMGLSFALAKSARSDRTLRDSDLLGALSAIAKSYETLTTSGLHYSAPVSGLGQQAVLAELQTMVKEYREAELKHIGYSRLKDSDVLRALVFLLRMGYTRTSGRPKAHAFADFVVSQFPEDKSTIVAAEAGSRIIVP